MIYFGRRLSDKSLNLAIQKNTDGSIGGVIFFHYTQAKSFLHPIRKKYSAPILPSVLFWTRKGLYLTYFYAENYNIILYRDDRKISCIENIAVATTNKHKKIYPW